LPSDYIPPPRSDTGWKQYVLPACMGTALFGSALFALIYLSQPVSGEEEPVREIKVAVAQPAASPPKPKQPSKPLQRPTTKPSADRKIKRPSKQEMAEFETDMDRVRDETHSISRQLLHSARQYRSKIDNLGFEQLIDSDSMLNPKRNELARSRLRLARQYLREFQAQVSEAYERARTLFPDAAPDIAFSTILRLIEEERKCYVEVESLLSFIASRVDNTGASNGKPRLKSKEDVDELRVRVRRLDDMLIRQEKTRMDAMQKLQEARDARFK